MILPEQLTQPNLVNQVHLTESTQPNLENQIYPIKPYNQLIPTCQSNLSNQSYQIETKAQTKVELLIVDLV